MLGGWPRRPARSVCAETAEAAALRELREETGYAGRVLSVSPALAMSPGLTDESVRLVVVEVKLLVQLVS